MKLTQSKKVMEIVRPPIVGMRDCPAVKMSDSIVQAIEQMLKNDLEVIAVTGNGRLVGHISLSDALEYLGLQFPEHPTTGGSNY